MITVTVQNKNFMSGLRGYLAGVEQKTSQVVANSSVYAKTVFQATLSRNGQHSPNTLPHAPSGETPRMETGRLYDSVQVTPMQQIGFGVYSASAEVTAPYAQYVDQGTARTYPHPFAEMTRDTVEALIREDIIAELSY